MAQLPKFVDFLKGFKIWGLPAIIGVLGPWYGKIMSFKLVSEYYQPELNNATSTIAASSCLVAYSVLLRKTIKSKIRILILCSTIFFICLCYCLAMQVLQLPIYSESTLIKDILTYINIVAYTLIFVCFSIMLVCEFLLFPQKKDEKKK